MDIDRLSFYWPYSKQPDRVADKLREYAARFDQFSSIEIRIPRRAIEHADIIIQALRSSYHLKELCLDVHVSFRKGLAQICQLIRACRAPKLDIHVSKYYECPRDIRDTLYVALDQNYYIQDLSVAGLYTGCWKCPYDSVIESSMDDACSSSSSSFSSYSTFMSDQADLDPTDDEECEIEDSSDEDCDWSFSSAIEPSEMNQMEKRLTVIASSSLSDEDMPLNEIEDGCQSDSDSSDIQNQEIPAGLMNMTDWDLLAAARCRLMERMPNDTDSESTDCNTEEDLERIRERDQERIRFTHQIHEILLRNQEHIYEWRPHKNQSCPSSIRETIQNLMMIYYNDHCNDLHILPPEIIHLILELYVAREL